MKLIIGLGNPGGRYAGTYHNLGFEVVDEIARRHEAPFGASPAEAVTARIRDLGEGVMLAKPLTFMNRSGPAVRDLQHYFRVALPDLLVVTDDVNLPAGRLRARPAGSAGGHNGLRSILEALGTSDVPRLRVGVGRGLATRQLADHVLSRIEPGERPVLDAAVAAAADAATLFVTAGIDEVMNRFNGPRDQDAS